MGPTWTDSQPLPGGGFATLTDLVAELQRNHPSLPPAWIATLARRHGSLAEKVIGDAESIAALGRDFGGGLVQREIEYFIAHEWAQSAEDILWRRSKAGLSMTSAQQNELHDWLAQRQGHPEFRVTG